MRYSVVEENFNIDPTVRLRGDKVVELTIAKSKGLYPDRLRLVEFNDEINDELLTFDCRLRKTLNQKPTFNI